MCFPVNSKVLFHLRISPFTDDIGIASQNGAEKSIFVRHFFRRNCGFGGNAGGISPIRLFFRRFRQNFTLGQPYHTHNYADITLQLLNAHLSSASTSILAKFPAKWTPKMVGTKGRHFHGMNMFPGTIGPDESEKPNITSRFPAVHEILGFEVAD
jgi:hypothetical protein